MAQVNILDLEIKKLREMYSSIRETLREVEAGMKTLLAQTTPLNFGSKKNKFNALLDLYIKHLEKIKKQWPSGSDQARNIEEEIKKIERQEEELKRISNYHQYRSEIAGLLGEIDKVLKIALEGTKRTLTEKEAKRRQAA